MFEAGSKLNFQKYSTSSDLVYSLDHGCVCPTDPHSKGWHFDGTWWIITCRMYLGVIFVGDPT